MEASEKGRFLQMLEKAMGAYAKPLPDAGIINAWIDMLKPYPLRVIGMAFAAYCDENGEFAPIPAGIAKRCKMMDGRPSADEAWAIALTSRDEADTVVWTEETAEAFGICSPVLEMGDEVGARRSFIEAYNRLVTAARLNGKPTAWNVSLGWDKDKREAVIQRAHVAGLLSAPIVQNLLPNYSGLTAEQEATYPEGLRRLKEELAKMQLASYETSMQHAREVEEARQAELDKKEEIAAQVAAYQAKEALANKAV